MIWEISLLIVSIGFVILVAFLVPTIVQLRRTAKRVEVISDSLNHHLPAILTNLDEITTNLTSILTSGRRQVMMLEEAAQEVKGMVDDIVQLEKDIKRRIEDPFVETFTTLAAVARAIRAFLDVLKEKR
ncbi:MAG: DUF948 domain-containing protein [Calditrichaeota bacterium]|nr:DUF948 domain-containing protein [Calditrichota bacterium]